MITSNIDNFSSMSIVRAKVDIYNESTLVASCDCEHNLQKFIVNREGDNSKFFGFGVCHKLTVDLIDLFRTLPAISTANTIMISLGDGVTFDNPYPTFYITEVNRDEKSNTITCTAYDKLYKAASHTLNELSITAPYTIRQLAEACATLLGVTLDIENVSDASFNTLYPEGGNFEDADTVRYILNAIAEATQTIYFINNQEQLVFKRLDKDGTAVYTVTKDYYYELNTKTSRILGNICSATELGENASPPQTITGAVQYVRDNPLWELRTDIDTLLNNAISNIGGLTIYQFDCDWSGNYLLEIGDKIALVTEDNNTVQSYVLSDAIEYAGTLNEITKWEYVEQTSDTESNPTNIGDKINQTFARVDKVNKKIELVIGDVDEHTDKLSKIQLDIDSISLTLEQHQKQIDDIEIPDIDLTEINEKISEIELAIDSIELSVSNTTTLIDNAVKDAKDYTDNAVDEAVKSTDSKIAAIQVTADNITASVSSLQQTTQQSLDGINESVRTITQELALTATSEELNITIENRLAEGVDSVVTASKNYRFDDNGLSVSSSTSSISTSITENGMSIERYGEQVLVADNSGVKAEDLHATTYLIIGNTSRLEDRNGRTACFWIGG